MKKTYLVLPFLVVTTLGVTVPNAQAQMGSMMGFGNEVTQDSGSDHGESVETVLKDILSNHNVGILQDLDLTQVSDGEWERLGDAVMEVYHPGEAHVAMDEMMGGEGSDSLSQMHINMGQSYLGYANNNFGPGMMVNTLMWQTGSYGFYRILGVATWVLTLAFLGAGTYYFLNRAGKK